MTLTARPSDGSPGPDTIAVISAEVAAIRNLLAAFEQDHRRSPPAPDLGTLLPPPALRGLAALLLVGLVLMTAGYLLHNLVTVLVGLLLIFAGLPLLLTGLALWRFGRGWRQRRQRGLASAQHFAEQRDDLLQALLPYRQASLTWVANDLSNYEGRLDRRALILFGSSRGGFIAVLTFIIAGTTALRSFFRDSELVVSRSFQEWLWALFFVAVAAAISVSVGQQGLNATAEYQAILRQAIAVKQALVGDAKAGS